MQYIVFNEDEDAWNRVEQNGHWSSLPFYRHLNSFSKWCEYRINLILIHIFCTILFDRLWWECRREEQRSDSHASVHERINNFMVCIAKSIVCTAKKKNKKEHQIHKTRFCLCEFIRANLMSAISSKSGASVGFSMAGVVFRMIKSLKHMCASDRFARKCAFNYYLFHLMRRYATLCARAYTIYPAI